MDNITWTRTRDVLLRGRSMVDQERRRDEAAEVGRKWTASRGEGFTVERVDEAVAMVVVTTAETRYENSGLDDVAHYLLQPRSRRIGAVSADDSGDTFVFREVERHDYGYVVSDLYTGDEWVEEYPDVAAERLLGVR